MDDAEWAKECGKIAEHWKEKVRAAIRERDEARAELEALQSHLSSKHSVALIAAEQERDEARAEVESAKKKGERFMVQRDAAEQAAARLAAEVTAALAEQEKYDGLCNTTLGCLRAALAAHDERVRGGGA